MTQEQVKILELEKKMALMSRHIALIGEDLQRVKRARSNQVWYRRQLPTVYYTRTTYRPRRHYNSCVLSPIFTLLDSCIKLVFRAIEQIVWWIITRIFR